MFGFTTLIVANKTLFTVHQQVTNLEQGLK
ncbi:MAG: hypothetical protein JWP37_2652 [Mucilaginibacter sp.]|nr:hypothetical protein [Mucilaginibacter sp.]